MIMYHLYNINKTNGIMVLKHDTNNYSHIHRKQSNPMNRNALKNIRIHEIEIKKRYASRHR